MIIPHENFYPFCGVSFLIAILTEAIRFPYPKLIPGKVRYIKLLDITSKYNTAYVHIVINFIKDINIGIQEFNRNIIIESVSAEKLQHQFA